MSGQPLLSVIIPVYNREAYLKRCLESVTGQTMKDLEILVIDDGSTDGTPQIIEEFRQRDPERIRAFRMIKSGPAKARNCGIKEAKGRYLTFVDSDDFVDLDGYEIVCRAALEQDADVICTPAYRWQDGDCQVIGLCPDQEPNQDTIIYYTTSNLWNKLFRRDFLQEIGLEIPGFRIGEDTAFVMSVMTWAKKLIYVDHGYYHYELTEDSLSLASTERPWIVANAAEVKEWMLKSANPEHLEIIREVLQKQLIYLYQNNVKFQDQLWLYLKREQKFYLNAESEMPLFPNPGKQLKELLFRTTQLIPQIVYVNGFDPAFDVQRQERELAHSLFWEECKVIILNAENCDVNCCRLIQEAIRQEDYELAGAYFGMEHILDAGGIYVGNRIQPLDKWNGLRVNAAFFGYEISEAVSLQVFGGISGNSYMKQIVNCCRSCGYLPNVLPAILKEVLSGWEEEMEGEKETEAGSLELYGTGTFVLPEYGVLPLSVYRDYNTEAAAGLREYVLWQTSREWKERKEREAELVHLRNKAYQDALWQQRKQENLQKKLNKADQDLSWLQNQREHLQKKLDKARRDIAWQQGQRHLLQEKLNKAGQDLSWQQKQREILQKKLDQAEEELLKQREQYEKLVKEKEKIQNSVSYRLGRVITWIPCRIGSWLKRKK